MFVNVSRCRRRSGLVLASLLVGSLAACSLAAAAPVEKPVAGKVVYFAQGLWSALPQLGSDGKVRQCVLVAARDRAAKDGTVTTRLSFTISRGSGFTAVIQDDRVPTEEVLDDQAEILIDGRAFPSVGFPVAGTAFIFHPGDAAGALTALAKASRITLRSDGAGVDSGAIAVNLPADALKWLNACSRTFNIAIDRPTDPNAPDMPAPRPRSPVIVDISTLPPGPPGMSDKQKIEGWDASELRSSDGSIVVCFIRRHYVMGSEPSSRRMATFLMVSRKRGFTLMLKDSNINQPEGAPVEATLKVGDEPFTGFAAQVQGNDEIGIFPQHAAALAAVLEKGIRVTFTSKVSDNFEFPVQASVIPWLRACARRNGIAFEQAG
jgi:hypothetical protein